MTSIRIPLVFACIGWASIAAPLTADVSAVVKRLLPATVMVEWSSVDAADSATTITPATTNNPSTGEPGPAGAGTEAPVGERNKGKTESKEVGDPPIFTAHDVSHIDPKLVRRIVQTFLAGVPDVRVGLDAKNHLYVFARASDQQRLREWLRQISPRPSSVSIASGTVVSKDGLIATTRIADSPGTSAFVTFSDGRKFPAKVAVTDERSDLQLLKIDAPDLAPVELAESAAELGDEVISLMCTDIEDRRVGRGIVAARNQTTTRWFVDLIATDFEATPMSAGSPLSNLEGKLVGILVGNAGADTLWSSRNGGGTPDFPSSRAVRGSLAVPLSYVRDMLAKYEAGRHGVLQQGWMGITLSEGELVSGTRIKEVAEGSPAEEAGLKVGDLIVRIEGRAIYDAKGLKREIGRLLVGNKVQLGLKRDGVEHEVQVTLAPLPRSAGDPARRPGTGQPDSTDQSIRIWQQPLTLTPSSAPSVSGNAIPGWPAQTAIPATPVPAPAQAAVPANPGVPQVRLAVPPSAVQPGPPLAIVTYPPSAPAVVRVERSDIEQKLDALTRAVQSLHDDVSKLRDEFQRLDGERSK